MAQIEDLFGARKGEQGYYRLPVTTELGGYEVFIPLHVIRGAGEGPTVTLLSTLHGNEWMSIEVIRRVLERVDPHRLRGNVMAVPVGNPVALSQLRRNTPDDSDSPDMNRSFRGQSTWLSELLARRLAEDIFPRSDYLIDYHTQAWGGAFGIVIFINDTADSGLNRRNEELARAFGYPSLVRASDKGNATGAAGRLGVAAIGIEIGGAGWGGEAEERWIEANVMGAFNVFYHFGLLEGEPVLPDRFFYHGKRWRLSPSVGGYLESSTGPERLLDEVQEGEELGRVLSTATLEVLEVLKSPGRGLLYSMVRSRPVRPGDWAYGVADLATLEWKKT